jgi:predicted permease
MWLLRLALASLRALVRRDVIAGEIREEMEFHLHMREEDLRGRGLSPDEARRAASRRFGNLAMMQDRGYDVRGGGVMETVIQDLRYSLRLLVRQPTFSAMAIGTLALAMGVATALFSVIDAAMLRPLPFPQPEQIVSGAVRMDLDGRVIHPLASVADMRRWEDAGIFSAMAAWSNVPWGSVLDRPRPERVNAREVTEGYLAVHGVVPILGRDFTVADTTAGAPPIVMLSHAYWQSRLGNDPAVIGGGLRYDDVSATIVGVLPAGFYPDVALWRPMRVDATQAERRGRPFVYGRLRPGITIADAERRLSAITPVDTRRAQDGAEPALGEHVRLTSVLDQTIGGYQRTVAVLAAAAGLIMLIACVNIAGLLLARGAARRTELAVRSSLGAGRLRLIRQMLIESVTLSLAGGVIGTFLAWFSLNALVTILPMTLPPGSVAEVNVRVLGACAVLAVATGVAFGLAPARRLSRAEVGAAARGARGQGSALSRRGGQYLIGAEVALAVVLVVGAGLMIRSFARLTSVDLGFDPDAVVAFNVAPVATDPAVHARYYPDLLRAIQALPGIAAAGAVDHFALGGTAISMGVSVDGHSIVSGVRQVLPGYFEAMGMPLRHGRFRSLGDGAAGGSFAVINESAFRRLFPDGSIDSGLTVGKTTLDVIGVVADVLHGGPAKETQAEVFIPFNPTGSPSQMALGMTVVVRPHGRLTNLAGDLRRTAESVGPAVLVGDIRSGSDWFSDRVATPRHRTALLGLLGALGLALALVGVFSMTASAVARRTREIGVRMALGARPVDVVRRMVWDAGCPVSLGIVVGLGVAYYATRVVQSFLFETTAHDPATLAAVAVLMGIAALAAAWIPARRAALVDPVATLRAE